MNQNPEDQKAQDKEEADSAEERDEVLGGDDRAPKGVRSETVVDQLEEIDPGAPDPR